MSKLSDKLYYENRDSYVNEKLSKILNSLSDVEELALLSRDGYETMKARTMVIELIKLSLQLTFTKGYNIGMQQALDKLGVKNEN